MEKYELRPETIIDIIEKIPTDRVEVLMPELTEVILQAKLSYDFAKVLDPNAKATCKSFIWEDDGKGEVTVIHSLVSGKKTRFIMKTGKTIKTDQT